MPSFRDDFDELMERVRRGRDLIGTGYDPVYYLVFHPKHILAVKQQTGAWVARLANEGWQPEVFSIGEAISEILKNSPLRRLWLAADRQNAIAWDKTNQALTNELAKGALQARLQAVLAELALRPNGILLVTDLEGLHPYLRIGTVESQLQGKFLVPTIFLYPGERTGASRLRFLGFYPEDGNYRSVHVGG